MKWVSHRREVSYSPFSPRSRAERLIAAGRVVLACFSLFAIWLDPSEPAKHASAAYGLLAGYVGYSVLVTVVVWRTRTALTTIGLATHILDLAIFTSFLYFTEGPTSPFFVFFLFSVTSATLRWQWRGVLWTAVAALTLYFGLGFYAAEVVGDPTFELNRFIIRSVYMAVGAALLAYLGAYEERLRGEIRKLSAWPYVPVSGAQELLQETLKHAAHVFGSSRVIMLWEEPEEPWLHLATCHDGGFSWTHHPPGTFCPLVAEPLAEVAFLCTDAGAECPAVLWTSAEGLRQWRGAPVNSALQARFKVQAVLSCRLDAQSAEGRIFFLDKRQMTSDDLLLADIVARQVIVRMDQFHLSQQLKHAAVLDERIRLARDLHDGVAQSLTGAALQLESVRQMLPGELHDAQERLTKVQGLLQEGQRELRLFIEELRPERRSRSRSALSDLAERLRDLADRFQRQWGLAVQTDIDSLRLPEPQAGQVYRIVQEALVNAARHSHATLVRVRVNSEGGRVGIAISDDGRGFPFHGRYEHRQLIEMKLGPITLKERIISLGGSLLIDSAPTGARLEISLPISPAQNQHAD